MFELKVTGIIINFLIALYAMVKAHKAAVNLIGMWNCT